MPETAPETAPQTGPQTRIRRFRTLSSFLRTEAGSAVVLLSATIVALIWANVTPEGYDTLWHTDLGPLDAQHWVNDGLMVLFFLVVGLEVKRELVEGELQDRRAAALPVIAALGGIIVPAALYLAVAGSGEASSGWGIPVATDIAFALGVLALLGDRVPAGLKVLLLSIAIADDIGAILIIAIAYSDGIDPRWLGLAVAALILVAVLRRLTDSWWVFALLGLVAWWATHESGVHATIAGVALGLLTPVERTHTLEHRLHPISSYVVLPIFALANAGVVLTSDALAAAVASPIALGIVLGLVAGKTIGIAGGALLAVRTGVGRLPLGVHIRHVVALAPIGGIGFTVSLFIAGLTFADSQLAAAKVGILVGSVLAGVLGAVALRALGRRWDPAASR